MGVLKKLASLLRDKIRPQHLDPSDYEVSREWLELNKRINCAKQVVDLGCGANPHPKATVAVDAFIDPLHRGLGQGPQIDLDIFQKKGIRFVHATIDDLPFPDKEFDFAYSHHAFEHLPDPKKACAEICRIAKSGAIITPSVFAEYVFGRPYHLWFVTARGNRLVFIRKTPREDRPFGDHPLKDGSGGFLVTPESNRFDMLLNDNWWYRGRERMPRISALLRKYWYSHSPVMEVVFLWEGSFDCTVIYEDGTIA